MRAAARHAAARNRPLTAAFILLGLLIATALALAAARGVPHIPLLMHYHGRPSGHLAMHFHARPLMHYHG